MLTLNLLPTSGVTLIKPTHNYHPNPTRSLKQSPPLFPSKSNPNLPQSISKITPFSKPYSQIHPNSPRFVTRAASDEQIESPILKNPKFPLSVSKITHFSNSYSQIHRNPVQLSLRAASDEQIEPEKTENPSKKLQLALVFGLWYFHNIVFNIYNKKALNIFPFPWLLASFQLFVGSVWMLILWSLKIQPCPKISKPFIFALLGPALFHTIGHISACVSFSKVAVSFTHVIKSSEPVFSVIFSSFLGDTYPLKVWLSIVPIVLGCSLAAITEVSFNFQGLWGALISNVGFVLRNIYSKKSLQSFKEVNGLNLYGWISIISLMYLFPVAVYVEGSQWVSGYHKAIESIGKPATFYIWVMLSGIFYHLYNQSSYEALDQISPLTFSVSNTMKRVVVIASSLVVFRNPVRPLNLLGSAVAILGAFLYTQASSKKVAKKSEGEKKD